MQYHILCWYFHLCLWIGSRFLGDNKKYFLWLGLQVTTSVLLWIFHTLCPAILVSPRISSSYLGMLLGIFETIIVYNWYLHRFLPHSPKADIYFTCYISAYYATTKGLEPLNSTKTRLLESYLAPDRWWSPCRVGRTTELGLLGLNPPIWYTPAQNRTLKLPTILGSSV